MPAAELVKHIQSVFEAEEERNGQTNHRDVALALVGESSIAPHIGRDILRMPTRPHLYEGAETTLRSLLESNGENDRVVIWTQGNPTGQLWKVAMSGLSGLRKEYGRDRFGIHASENKIATLPALFDELATQGTERIVLVDDKAKNIQKVARTAQLWGAAHPNTNVEIIPVWINQGRTKDQVPQGHTVESFTAQYNTITDIRQVQRLQQHEKPTTWLIDWDHTLNETATAKKQLFDTIATHIEEIHPQPVLGSHKLDLQARIVGATTITDLPNGMSGRRVLEARHPQNSIVVKHAPGSEKTVAEIRGIRHLQHMPHKAFMPAIHHMSESDGIIAMERVTGTSGRDKVQSGDITAMDKQLVDTIVNMELRWLSEIVHGAQVIPPEMQLRSMQREEFADTKLGISHALDTLSKTYNISSHVISSEPLYFNESFHLPFTQALQTLETLYQATENDTRFPLHGDISWGNMIFDKTTIHVIDGEWAGLHDPAEAYARTAKVISTTTTPRGSLQCSVIEGLFQGQRVIALETSDPFSEDIKILQHHMLTRGNEFAITLQNPQFMKKLYMYLAGSYAREIALASKRGLGPNEQVFALKQFIEMIELSQSL